MILILVETCYFVCSSLSSCQSADSVLELSYLHSLLPLHLSSTAVRNHSNLISFPSRNCTTAHAHTTDGIVYMVVAIVLFAKFSLKLALLLFTATYPIIIF